MKALLSNCVASAIQYDKELKTYYHRKLVEGKDSGVVLNAIKNKLFHRVFAVIKRQTPPIGASLEASVIFRNFFK